jgi:hypothetical protein
MSRIIHAPTKPRNIRHRARIGLRYAALHKNGTIIERKDGTQFRSDHDKGAGDRVWAYWTPVMRGMA